MENNKVNINTMDYSQFLFVNLLMSYNDSFRGLPYDDMWSDYKIYYQQFWDSKYNINEEDIYNCLENFIIGTKLNEEDFNV